MNQDDPTTCDTPVHRDTSDKHGSGARLESTPEACSRARARDERVARGRRANRLGRVWLKLAPVCHGVLMLTRPQEYGIGWGGCGQLASVCHGVLMLTRPHTYRIGWGGCGPSSVRRLCGRVGCTTTATYLLGVAQVVSGSRAVSVVTQLPSPSGRAFTREDAVENGAQAVLGCVHRLVRLEVACGKLQGSRRSRTRNVHAS